MRPLRSIVLLAATASIAIAAACGTSHGSFDLSPGNDSGLANDAGNGTGGGLDGNSSYDGFGPILDASLAVDTGASDTGAPPSPPPPTGCAAGCGTGQICEDGGCVCPIYQSFCGGQCIPTTSDPNNCGACGAACDGGTACSGGACETSCMPGLIACAGACVDPSSDSANCGGCGKACPTGQGCVTDQSGSGSCQTALVATPPAGGCVGGGPPIVVTDGDAGATCTGAIAQTLFTWALCSCTNVTVSQTFLTDAYNSAQGPYQAPPHQLGGGVGLNGMMTVSNGADIYGTLWASSSSGTTASTPLDVYQDLHSGGSIGTSTSISIADDAYVNGNIGGKVSIGATLYQPSTDTRASNVTFGTLVTAPVTVPQPCCGPADQVPVAGIVAGAAASNDDATSGFTDTVLASGSTLQRLDLPCGNYYFTEIKPQHALTIVAHGHTAIYVQGDISSSNPIEVTLDPGMTLDVFIAGTLNVSQVVTLGNPNYPALMRVYVGTTGTVVFSQVAHIAADFYAMYAHPVSWSQVATVFGSVYVGDFIGSQVTSIHYDRAALSAGESCPGLVPVFDAGPGVDAAIPPVPPCQSCTDCGNQACVSGTCGGCTDDSQCCAPLQCENGTCVLSTK
jgi:Stigma-specific protein, Stig1